MAAIEFTARTADRVEFRLTNAEPELAAALNRILQQDVPMLSILEAVVEPNDDGVATGVVAVEELALRLGSVPVVAVPHVDRLRLRGDCACDDGRCDQCSIELALDVAVPSDAGEQRLDVTTRHLTPVRPLDVPLQFGTYRHAALPDLSAREADRGVYITTLREGQGLRLRCWVRKQRGSVHAKWTPCLAYFKPEPHVVIHNDVLRRKLGDGDDRMEAVGRSCPMGVFRWDAATRSAVVVDPSACTYCQNCTQAAQDYDVEDAVRVGSVERAFLFVVEVRGFMVDPVDLVGRAVAELGLKLDRLAEFLDATVQ
jgi:DNA-directed RNA polymerase alpha subunit